MTKRGLVLSGGGAKGAFQAGCIHELARNGAFWDVVMGTSVGALNGLLVAQDRIDRLADIWLSVIAGRDDVLSGNTVWNAINMALGRRLGLYDTDPLRDHIRAELEQGTITIPFLVCVTDLNDGVSYNSAPTPSAILASATIPIIFNPVRDLNGDLLVDGGVRDQTPLASMIKRGCSEIDVIMCNPLKSNDRQDDIDNALDVLKRTIDVMSNEIMLNDVETCVKVNDLIAASGRDRLAGHRLITLRVFAPTTDLGDTLNFDPVRLSIRFAEGVRNAQDGPLIESPKNQDAQKENESDSRS